MRTLSHRKASQSTLLLRRLGLWRPRRWCLPLRRSRSRTLLLPLIKLLRLLLFLLRRSLLHGRSRPHQRVRLRRRIELAVPRFCRTARRFATILRRHAAIFLRRSSLLLVHARLWLEHRLYLRIVILIPSVGLPE